jgi:cell wall-associated NlpC family hydrolase
MMVGAGGVVPATATLSSDTSTPPPPAPCYLAALAALTRQGALYSQGGALAYDPINPDTHRPYPRTGPQSFDCSGLVRWSYAQAGTTIGQTTETQLNDGVALPCTLDDLNGAATRCWTLGDLVFLAYPAARVGCIRRLGAAAAERDRRLARPHRGLSRTTMTRVDEAVEAA